MAGPKGPELGTRSPFKLRGGRSFPAFKGVVTQWDPGALAPNELQVGYNVQTLGGALTERGGQSRVNVSGIEGELITGVYHANPDEIERAASAVPGQHRGLVWIMAQLVTGSNVGSAMYRLFDGRNPADTPVDSGMKEIFPAPGDGTTVQTAGAGIFLMDQANPPGAPAETPVLFEPWPAYHRDANSLVDSQAELVDTPSGWTGKDLYEVGIVDDDTQDTRFLFVPDYEFYYILGLEDDWDNDLPQSIYWLRNIAGPEVEIVRVQGATETIESENLVWGTDWHPQVSCRQMNMATLGIGGRPVVFYQAALPAVPAEYTALVRTGPSAWTELTGTFNQFLRGDGIVAGGAEPFQGKAYALYQTHVANARGYMLDVADATTYTSLRDQFDNIDSILPEPGRLCNWKDTHLCYFTQGDRIFGGALSASRYVRMGHYNGTSSVDGHIDFKASPFPLAGWAANEEVADILHATVYEEFGGSLRLYVIALTHDYVGDTFLGPRCISCPDPIGSPTTWVEHVLDPLLSSGLTGSVWAFSEKDTKRLRWCP